MKEYALKAASEHLEAFDSKAYHFLRAEVVVCGSFFYLFSVFFLF
jgi:hypothetical protein